MSDRPKIFAIGGTVSPRDPLDLMPLVRRAGSSEFDVIDVRPGSATTIRGVMQSRRPDQDVVLFDFSDPYAVQALIDLPRTLPAVVLMGATVPRSESPALRAWQALAAANPEDWPLATILALDANIGGQAVRTSYPLASIPTAPPAIPANVRESNFLCFGSPDALYGALLGWRGQSGKSRAGRLTLALATHEDVIRLGSYIAALDMQDQVAVTVAASRLEIVRLCGNADAVADISPIAWPGKTVPILAARCWGIAAMRIDVPPEEIPTAIQAFLGDFSQGGGAPIPTTVQATTSDKSARAFEIALFEALNRSQMHARLSGVAG